MRYRFRIVPPGEQVKLRNVTEFFGIQEAKRLLDRASFAGGRWRARATEIAETGESDAVKTQRPIAADDEHRVLQFRPRNTGHPAAWRQDTNGPQRAREARERGRRSTGSRALRDRR